MTWRIPHYPAGAAARRKLAAALDVPPWTLR